MEAKALQQHQLLLVLLQHLCSCRAKSCGGRDSAGGSTAQPLRWHWCSSALLLPLYWHGHFGKKQERAEVKTRALLARHILTALYDGISYHSLVPCLCLVARHLRGCSWGARAEAHSPLNFPSARVNAGPPSCLLCLGDSALRVYLTWSKGYLERK